jgi:hypothetical protein
MRNDKDNKMPTTSSVPNSTLAILNPAPPPGVSNTPPSRFLLFTNSWLNVQNYITATLKLPIAVNDFTATYGTFPDQALITNTVEAMKRVRGLSDTFGNPTLIKQKLITQPDYLQTTSPPDEVYAHIIWLANQIYNAANSFSYTLAQLQAFLATGTPQQRADNLKAILIGPGGLVSTADDMRQKTNALSTKLLSFGGKFGEANDQLQKYTGSQSQVLKDANDLIGSINDTINNVLRPAADEALKQWRDYTIAAVTTSVGVTVLSAGLLLPVAVGLAAGLGVAATKARDAYNTVCDQIDAANQDIKRKSLLVTDLQGFNVGINQVAPAMAEFNTNLGVIESVWVDIGSNLAFICNNYTVEQLSNYSWVMQAMKIGDATAKWNAIGNVTQDFTQHALVNYDASTSFGQKLPVNTAKAA